jgi:hypothetical protein
VWVAIAATMAFSMTLYSDDYLRQSTGVFIVDKCSSSEFKDGSSSNHMLHASQQHGHWVGTSWIPPTPSWRLYDPVEMLQAYSGKSVLFVGDSTSRRLAQTLFSLLEETEHGMRSNPLTLQRYQQSMNATPHTNVNQHVSHATLSNEETLAYSKITTEVCPFLQELAIFQHNGTIDSRNTSTGMPNDIDVYEQFPYKFGFCHETPAFPSRAPMDLQGKRSSGLLERSHATPMFVSTMKYCPCEVEHWIRSNLHNEYNQLSRFDVVVVGTGVWEAVRAEDCRGFGAYLYPGNSTLAARDAIQIAEETMLSVAEYIKTQYARQERQRADRMTDSRSIFPKIPVIVWRTSGYDHLRNHSLIDDMNRHVIELYDAIVSESNGGPGDFRMADYFRLVDWGGAVRPRSFDR